jgi:hypothetical protein
MQFSGGRTGKVEKIQRAHFVGQAKGVEAVGKSGQGAETHGEIRNHPGEQSELLAKCERAIETTQPESSRSAATESKGKK